MEENIDKQQAIEQLRNSTIAMLEKFKGVNFDLMKYEIANKCMTNLSVVQEIIDTNIVCGEGGATLESIINDGNEEIRKVVNSVKITDEELEEVKKSMLDKMNFEMSKGELIIYQKMSEMATAYLTINSISNSIKNSLLESLPQLIKDKK